MREIEQLQKQWRDRVRPNGVLESMHIAVDGLVLGARTILAKRKHDGAIALDGREAKLLTLLSVAHGRAIGTSVLKSVRRASQCAEAGDKALAAMHVALALPALRDPVDAARRLFVAQGLMAKGVRPRDIWTALEFDPAPLDELEKAYNPAEPRNPKGDGKSSGEWTLEGAIAAGAAAAANAGQYADWAFDGIARLARAQAARMAGRLAALAGKVASRAALPLVILDEIANAPQTGGAHIEGDIRGFPDLKYSRYQDETGLQIKTASGRTFLRLSWRAPGVFGDKETGIVAHMEGDELVIGPPVPHYVSIPAPATAKEGSVPGRSDLRYHWNDGATELQIKRAADGEVVIRGKLKGRTFVDDEGRVVARLAGDKALVDIAPIPIGDPSSRNKRRKPDLCPAPDFDKLGRAGPKGEKDKDYEDYVKRKINPGNPTPRGFGYQLPNPLKNGRLVYYDDCRHRTGEMIEAKGTGYAEVMARPDDDFMKQRFTELWLDQAERQVAAAAADGRKVEWHFAEEGAADYAKKLFAGREDLQNIKVVYTYWREGMK